MDNFFCHSVCAGGLAKLALKCGLLGTFEVGSVKSLVALFSIDFLCDLDYIYKG